MARSLRNGNDDFVRRGVWLGTIAGRSVGIARAVVDISGSKSSLLGGQSPAGSLDGAAAKSVAPGCFVLHGNCDR